MKYTVGVKFTYYRMGISVSKMTEFESINEIKIDHEQLAIECIDEIQNTTGMDLEQISKPYPATRFCFLSELLYEPETKYTIEGERVNIIQEELKSKRIS